MSLIGIDQNPFLKTYPAIVANATLFFFALVKKPALKTYLMIFSATTLVDILVAGKIIPLGNPEVQTSVEYIFVVIGDLRFIILLAFLIYARRDDVRVSAEVGASMHHPHKKMEDLESFRLDGSVIKPALVFMMFASLLVQAIDYAKPGLFSEPRRRFLTYELISLTLSFLWIYAVMPQKSVADREAKFLRRVAIPVFGYYGLWSLADILILNGIEAGHAIRIVPNLIYYCIFLWWVSAAGQKT